MKTCFDDGDWWRVLLEVNALNDREFHQLLGKVCVLFNTPIALQIHPSPAELTPCKLSEDWYFQLKWGRKLLHKHASLSPQEQADLNLPHLPLSSETVSEYLRMHHELCRSRSWHTACWMSIAAVLRIMPTGLDESWRLIWQSRLSVHINEVDFCAGLVPLLSHLQRLKVIEPHRPFPKRLLTFLDSIDGFRSQPLPESLDWIAELLSPVQPETMDECSSEDEQTFMDVLSSTDWTDVQSVESAIDFINDNIDEFVDSSIGQTRRSRKVSIVKDGVVVEEYTETDG